MTDPTGMIGDYYSRDGTYLTNDGIDDQKVYFADVAKIENGEIYAWESSIKKTTIEAVLKAQGNGREDINPIQMLAGTAAATAEAGVTGMLKGAGNFLINNSTPGLLGVVPNIPYDNAAQASYGNATETGLALGTVVAGGALSGGSSLSVVPETPQMSRGAQMITDLVGGPGQARGQLNSAGDLVITGREFKFRVDFRNPGGDRPHLHLEQLINGKWRDAIKTHRIYPQP